MLSRLLTYIYTYHIKLFTFNSLTLVIAKKIYTIIIRLLIEKPFFFETIKLFILNSVRVYRYIYEILCPRGGAFDFLFCLKGGVLYTIVPMGGFLLLSSRVPGVCLIFIAHSLYRVRTRPGKSCQEPMCVPCLWVPNFTWKPYFWV